MAKEAGGEKTTEQSSGRSRGRGAARPRDIPLAGWGDILARVKDHVAEHDLSLVAAGLAFFALLAIFPTLTLVISIYGLVADPSQVPQQLNALQGTLPPEVQSILVSQMNSVASSSGAALSVGGAIAFVLTLWSASGGVRALMRALNVAYSEKETRGFLRFNGLALLLTLGVILMTVLAFGLVVALPILLAFLGLPGWLQAITYVLPWCILAVVVTFALSALYRYGPDRAQAQWKWLSLGAVTATALWLIGSALFSIYVAKFGSYNATYGSFAAIVILLLWLFLTAFAVLLGAEISAETEHQTERDTTVGEDKPLGERGAHVADTVGKQR